MRTVSFTVYGTAAPAGSKRGFVNAKTKHVQIVDANKNARPWKAQVADSAAQAMNGKPLLDGPLELQIRFYIPRPKGHYGTGRNAGTVKPSAPPRPATAPDATKLLRAVEDAMQQVIYGNDAQIVTQHVEKHYGEPARAVVAVAQLESPLKPPTTKGST